jgi:hypothetical protein
MTALDKRSTRLNFKTSDTVWDRGRRREVVIEAHPRTCSVRLAGMRTSFTVEWSAIHSLAVKMAVAASKTEKKTKKRTSGK